MRIFISIIFSIITFSLQAQGELLDFESFDGGSDEIKIEKIKGKSILIVPFSFDLYNNQESKDMAPASKMEYEQMINFMRMSLDSAIVGSLKDSVRVISLLTNFTSNTESDLEYVHGHSIYYMAEKPIPLVESDQKYDLFVNKKNGSSPSPLAKNIKEGEIVSEKEDISNKFLNVKFDNPALINNIATKYQTRYLLFITEFDLFGDYSNPYSVAEKTYFRTIRVHYSIYDNTGEFIHGNFVTKEFPAVENDVVTVCRENFPEIAKKIAKNLP